jgi:hypothetical protein
MDGQPCAADLDSLCKLPGAPVFLGELRKSNRRRVLLDPAPQVFDARIVGHSRQFSRP